MNIIPSQESILPKHELANEGKPKDRTIVNQSEFINLALTQLGGEQLPSKARKQHEKDGCRTRVRVEKFTIKDMIGNVTPEKWAKMVNSMLAAMKKNIQHSQNNGDWKVCDFEQDIMEDNAGTKHLYLGVRYIDVSNSEDLGYTNGQPSMNVNVKTSTDPALLEALQNNNSTTGDPELKELLKLLIARELGSDVSLASVAEPAVEVPVTNDDDTPFS